MSALNETKRLTGDYAQDMSVLQEALDALALFDVTSAVRSQTLKRPDQIAGVVVKQKVFANQMAHAKVIGIEHNLGRTPEWAFLVGVPNPAPASIRWIDPHKWTAGRIMISCDTPIAANSFTYIYVAIGG